MGMEGIEGSETEETDGQRLERLRAYAGAPEGATKDTIYKTLGDDGLASIAAADERFLLREDPTEDSEDTEDAQEGEMESDGERFERLKKDIGAPESAKTPEHLRQYLDDPDILSPDDEEWLNAA